MYPAPLLRLVFKCSITLALIACTVAASHARASYYHPIASVTAGREHTCWVLKDGTVRCNGGNSYGQLGDGTTTRRLSAVAVSGLSGVVQASAGDYHTCALTAAGQVMCWGANSSGQLGNGATTARVRPGIVNGLSNVEAVASGGAHTCALLADETVRCWGWAIAVGDGTNGSGARLTPVKVVGLSGMKVDQITAGYNHSCASVRKYQLSGYSFAWRSYVMCWGSGSMGQLGNNSARLETTPVTVVGVGGTLSISAGGGHTCAVLTDGTVRCWGDNGFGQLGNGETSTLSKVPVAARGLTGAKFVSTGGGHTCAKTATYNWCWGRNVEGQVGSGSTDIRVPLPTPIWSSSYYELSAGSLHTCSDSGTCWGLNSTGQLGDGTTTARRTPVVGSPAY